ncbi:NAD-glutamate dehydrogenase domain-containing protein [Micromonospora sp. DT47]|uniref:NAD-glutamate dehydrogenase domain-containing protein n=1 Tax=Micromonospora sp. DT47 TaxID=3393431 RepID=UPI003CEB9AA7
MADRAYALIARLASYNPLIFGSVADEILASTIGGDAAVRNVFPAARRPLSPGRGVTSFGDTANIMGATYATWLGAAFSAGGSGGYDYKALGITARGAWESVKLRLKVAGIDSQAQDFTAVGVGDMSGDVFGNGMLLSKHIRLIAAFDHRHIFLDPSPNAEVSYLERKRLFDLPHSSWTDYNRNLISKGGGVWPQSSNSIPLSFEAREALGIASPIGEESSTEKGRSTEEISPAEMIRAILRARVDLLWYGGIGTYVKGSSETLGGDVGNEHLHVDGRDVACKVVCEAGTQGLTPRGRVEYARRGGSVTADFVDGSGGVGFFDREVNVRILLSTAVKEEALTRDERGVLLAGVAGEIAAMVLRDSRDQVVALNASAFRSRMMLPVHRRMVTDLERRGQIDRSVEGMADDAELAERASVGLGLTMPELSVLLAHVKIMVAREILGSTLPEEDWTSVVLSQYFPLPLRSQLAQLIADHPMRREIVATELTNEAVNRAGITFFFRAMEETKASAAEVLRAYVTARDAFGLTELWQSIDALEGISEEARRVSLLELRELLDWSVRWLLASRHLPIDVASEVHSLGPTVTRLLLLLDSMPGAGNRLRADIATRVEAGLPSELAERIARAKVEFGVLDIVDVTARTGRDIAEVADVYLALSSRFRAGWLRRVISALPHDDGWQARARMALQRQLYRVVAAVTVEVLSSSDLGKSAHDRVLEWETANAEMIARANRLLGELDNSRRDLPKLIVLLREIRTLAGRANTSLQREVMNR